MMLPCSLSSPSCSRASGCIQTIILPDCLVPFLSRLQHLVALISTVNLSV